MNEGPPMADEAATRWPRPGHHGLGRSTVVLLTVALATLTAGVRAGVVVARNAPFDPLVTDTGLLHTVTIVALVAAVLGFVAIAVATPHGTVRVGALFAGTFGLLGAVAEAAALPATVGIIGGSAVAVFGTDRDRGIGDTYLPGGLLLAGTAVTLASMIGVLDGTARTIGGWLVLLGLASLAVRVAEDRVALLWGVAVALGFVAAVAGAPFAAGSALLVGFGVVDIPLVVVAVGLGGAVAHAVHGLRAGRATPVLGVGLLLAAGMPVTVVRAVPFLLGAVVVLAGMEAVRRAENRSTGGIARAG
ncbi:MAG: hypothetical protein ACLFM8_08260 [Halobacteriales archaeon]